MLHNQNIVLKGFKGLLTYLATPAMLVFLIWYSTKKEANQEARDNAQDELMFENSRQRVKIIEFSESDYNPISVYEQGKKIEKSFGLIDTIFKQHRKDDSIKKIDKKRIVKSREARDSVNRLILQKLSKLDSLE